MVPVPGKGKEGKTGSGLVAVLFLENKNVEQEGITENNRGSKSRRTLLFHYGIMLLWLEVWCVGV